MTGSEVVPASVVVVHGVVDASRPDEADTLDQVRQVAAALARLGHATDVRAIGLDLSPLASGDLRGSLVFNLVEALAGDGRLIHLPAAVMEHAGVAYTGCSAGAIALTTDKLLTKRLLAAQGLAVPETWQAERHAGDRSQRFIVKSVSEDASLGIDAGSVVTGAEVEDVMAERAARFGGAWLAERYIDGREINVSLLEGEDGRPRVLPIAEIEFVGYAAERPRIVDYEAKWMTGSAAYTGTPRRFLSRFDEPRLYADLQWRARAAWDALGLSGYARIDFRVDAEARPFILEANANPCLAADAGFAAACAEARLDYDATIASIVAAAWRRIGAASPSGRG